MAKGQPGPLPQCVLLLHRVDNKTTWFTNRTPNLFADDVSV